MVIGLMEGDKAPGTDGFPILFYKKYWEVIKNDVMQVFKDIHKRDFLECNFSFPHLEEDTCGVNLGL